MRSADWFVSLVRVVQTPGLCTNKTAPKLLSGPSLLSLARRITNTGLSAYFKLTPAGIYRLRNGRGIQEQ